MIPAVLLLAIAPGAPDHLAQIESAIADIDARRALLAIPNAPDPARAVEALRAQLDALERDLRNRLDTIDADARLLIDPDLRQQRSDLAIVDLHLRLPTARARLVAIDPRASDDAIATAIDRMHAIDYAWGAAATARRAALGALLLRTRAHDEALALFSEADGSDPLVRLARTACRAATGKLSDIPFTPEALEAALFGAALGASEITAAGSLAEQAILTAPAWALELARDTVYTSLRTLAARHGARPPMVRIALAETPDELRRIIALPPSRRSELTKLEAHWRLWELSRDAPSLLETALRHPNPGARRAAATRCTSYLETAPPSDRLAAKALYDRLPEHPHRGQWLLMYAEVAPVDDALRALDERTDPSIESAALLVAARRSYDSFSENPSSPPASERLLRRAHDARAAAHTAQWNAWLVRVIAEGTLARDGAVEAAEWILAQAADHTQAGMEFLAPHALDAALDAEAKGDAPAQTRAAELAERLASAAARPVIRSRALTLAGRPDDALRALAAAASPEANLARAEALYALQRDEDAFPLYRVLAESHEANRRDTDAYWRAWTRMLQIIERREGDNRHEEIAREINRLRIQDKRLGGDPHRRRLESLLDRATPGTPRDR